ncbi:hypothetical protein [Deinococcus hopiensis]|uniref:hypothetical protein n=1 Tax=Deinococcus hopiensis TaxID=309885 RepID=UPI00111C07A3|nr:hypothetical protein [Deinococcus hopiensis]
MQHGMHSVSQTDVLSTTSLLHYSFPPGFEQRLAADERLSIPETQLLLREYRRFLVLASTGPVSPSHRVDAAWHLHLTYTRDYWERLPECWAAPCTTNLRTAPNMPRNSANCTCRRSTATR